MDSTGDGANGGMLPSGGIDQSVGYLLAGLAIIFFFLLTVVGMGRVQQISSEAAHTHAQQHQAPASEIGGAGDPANR